VPLAPGRYSINVGFYPTDWSFIYDYHWQMHPLTIVGTAGQLGETSGLVALDGAWLLTPLDECGVSPTPSTPPSDLELRP
jgi:lipopolysaccharide transport system ATP-binding protein